MNLCELMVNITSFVSSHSENYKYIYTCALYTHTHACAVHTHTHTCIVHTHTHTCAAVHTHKPCVVPTHTYTCAVHHSTHTCGGHKFSHTTYVYRLLHFMLHFICCCFTHNVQFLRFFFVGLALCTANKAV
eukprot:GHVQ01000169.1.p1 GENE.GHVQ01000169.1~~GHVQ01000169.1.p1  ORF type:complete len:131 (-),score=8.77 GHVQ01000169.1:3-395(-)